VLIGSEYPPASQGVRFLVGVFEASPFSIFLCCSAATEFAFSRDVTSILSSGGMFALNGLLLSNKNLSSLS
jgi:hypothetical protein